MDQSYISSSAEADIETLEALEEKVRWLASWTIHNANHLRESRDGLKVGGHQASCASLSAIMTALYFHVLRSDDRVAQLRRPRHHGDQGCRHGQLARRDDAYGMFCSA